MLDRKIFRDRVRQFSERMNKVLYDAYGRIDQHRQELKLRHPAPEEVNLFSWPQAWPNAAVGFEDRSEPGPVVRQTHVVKDEVTGAVYVYHDGRFVRKIAKPAPVFWDAVRSHSLPGQVDEAAWRKLCLDE